MKACSSDQTITLDPEVPKWHYKKEPPIFNMEQIKELSQQLAQPLYLGNSSSAKLDKYLEELGESPRHN